MKNWFERLFSVDEMRVSALVLCMLAVVTACLVSCFTLGEINDNLLTLSEGIVFTVGGVSAVNGVRGIVSSVTSNTTDTGSEIVVTDEEIEDKPKI